MLERRLQGVCRSCAGGKRPSDVGRWTRQRWPQQALGDGDNGCSEGSCDGCSVVAIFQVYDTFPFQLFLPRYFNIMFTYEMEPYAYTFVREIQFCDMVLLFQVLAEVCEI
jgi:hypothetical protein